MKVKSSLIKHICAIIVFQLCSLLTCNWFSAADAYLAQATNGCPAPPPPTGNAWYVDPVNGSMSGDGSAAHPWHTLAEVVNAHLISSQTRGGGSPTYSTPLQPLNPKGVIKPGDVIYLMSGNHGS